MNDSKKVHILKGETVLVLKKKQINNNIVFSYSIPLDHSYQIPLYLKVNSGDVEYRIIDENNSKNKKIEFFLTDISYDVNIKIEYYVLIDNNYYNNMPKKLDFPSEKELPENIKIYLKPSLSIQSDSIFIKITSSVLKGLNKDMLWFTKKVLYWSAYQGVYFNFLKKFLVKNKLANRLFLPDVFDYKLEDALSALFFGSLCVGKANLQVALLRAQGIPARIIIQNSLYYGAKQWNDTQHYSIEFFCPGFGWVSAQTGCLPDIPKNGILLRRISIDEENKAGNGFSKQGGTPQYMWYNNKKISLGIPKVFSKYKLPSNKKNGFPAIRGFRIKELSIKDIQKKKLWERSRELWDLFTTNVGRLDSEKKVLFDKAKELHEKSLSHLFDSNVEECIDKLNESMDCYKKI
jgi:hypothetical protein